MTATGMIHTIRAFLAAALVMDEKPATMSVGDFLCKAALDSAIDAHKVAGDYRGLQGLLDTVFGQLVTGGTHGAERHKGGER